MARHRTVRSLVPALALVAAAAGADQNQPTASLTVEPSQIPVTMFYRGTTLRVSAVVPAADPIALLCSGNVGDLRLNVKGKVWGFLWMNVRDVRLHNVPALYKVASPVPLDELAPAAARSAAGVGFESLLPRVQVDKAEGRDAELLGELVELKERESLYAQSTSNIRVEALPDGSARLSASFWLPARTPFGTYEVAIVGFRDGRGTRLASASFTVQAAGLVAAMTALALRHGLLYGIIAVVVALSAGLLTGVLFGMASKKVH